MPGFVISGYLTDKVIRKIRNMVYFYILEYLTGGVKKPGVTQFGLFRH